MVGCSMDVERAIEHLLELHAKAEARMDRADARMEKAEARMDRFEKQLAVTAKLVRAGVKIVVEDHKMLRSLDRRFARLIQILSRQSTNGRGR